MYGMEKIDILTRSIALVDSAEEMDAEVDYTRPDASDLAKVAAQSHMYAHAASMAIRKAQRLQNRITAMQSEYDNLKRRFEEGPAVPRPDYSALISQDMKDAATPLD